MTLATMGAANAATGTNVAGTATLQTSAIVVPACTITGGTMGFGNITASTTSLPVNTTISATCTKTTPYDIRLVQDGSSLAMDGGATGNGDKLLFDLSINGQTVACENQVLFSAAVLDGTPQNYTVTGQVRPSQYVTPDSYTKALTLEVVY